MLSAAGTQQWLPEGTRAGQLPATPLTTRKSHFWASKGLSRFVLGSSASDWIWAQLNPFHQVLQAKYPELHNTILLTQNIPSPPKAQAEPVSGKTLRCLSNYSSLHVLFRLLMEK